MPLPLITLLLFTSVAARPAATVVTLPATAVTLGAALDAIKPQTGLALSTTLDPKTALKLDRRSGAIWDVLSTVATAAGGRLAVSADGATVTVEAGTPLPANTDGDFRAAVMRVAARRDFDGGGTVTEVTLLLHWEPRRPVFRVDSLPSGIFALDIGPTKPLPAGAGKVAVSSSAAALTVRVPGVPRGVKTLSLDANLTVTAAAEMLQFRVTGTEKPTTLTRQGVTAMFPVMTRIGDRWDVPVELSYPPSPVVFESFEAGVWLGRNRLQLVDAAGKPLSPVNEDWREAPGRANAVYRFRAADVPAARAGWSLVYETPSPLVEFPVSFRLGPFDLP
jgi:hypothetical protein